MLSRDCVIFVIVDNNEKVKIRKKVNLLLKLKNIYTKNELHICVLFIFTKNKIKEHGIFF